MGNPLMPLQGRTYAGDNSQRHAGRQRYADCETSCAANQALRRITSSPSAYTCQNCHRTRTFATKDDVWEKIDSSDDGSDCRSPP